MDLKTFWLSEKIQIFWFKNFWAFWKIFETQIKTFNIACNSTVLLKKILFKFQFLINFVVFLFGHFFWLMNNKFCMTKNLSGILEFVIFEFYVFIHEILDWMQYKIKLIQMKFFFKNFSFHFANHFSNWSWSNPRWTKVSKKLCEMYSIKLFTCSVFAIFITYFWDFF